MHGAIPDMNLLAGVSHIGQTAGLSHFPSGLVTSGCHASDLPRDAAQRAAAPNATCALYLRWCLLVARLRVVRARLLGAHLHDFTRGFFKPDLDSAAAFQLQNPVSGRSSAKASFISTESRTRAIFPGRIPVQPFWQLPRHLFWLMFP